MMKQKILIKEDGPLGDGWKLITGGATEITAKKGQGCEVKRASDQKFYYKCPASQDGGGQQVTPPVSDRNTSESWPEKFKCVSDGEQREGDTGEKYYAKEIEGVRYYFFKDGFASKEDVDIVSFKYKCEDGKPKMDLIQDLSGESKTGQGSDKWDYRKVKDPDNTSNFLYLVKKKTSNTWIYLNPKIKKYKNALEAVKKLFDSPVPSSQATSDVLSGSSQTSSQTPYPKDASKEITEKFNAKYPCLSQLKTKIGLDSDGDEYVYKVETYSDEKLFYFENGKVQIITKDDDGKKVTTRKFFRCP